MKKLLLIAVLSAGAAAASATTITFDDLPSAGQDTQIMNGYAGLNWSNFYALDTSTFKVQPSGYGYGIVSGTNVAYNAYGDPATVSSPGADQTFSVQDGYFTGAWHNGLQITATAVFADTTSTSLTFTVDSTAPTHQYFNWDNVQSLTFTSTGGTSAGYIAEGSQATHFALDNLTVSVVPVPEPGTFSLMGFGLLLGALASSTKRRKGS